MIEIQGLRLSNKGHRFYIIWDKAVTSSFQRVIRIITRSRIGNIIRKKLRKKTRYTGISRKDTRYVEVFKNVKSLIGARVILGKRKHSNIYKAIYFKGAEPEYLKVRN